MKIDDDDDEGRGGGATSHTFSNLQSDQQGSADLCSDHAHYVIDQRF